MTVKLKTTEVDKVWVDHGDHEAEYRIDKIEAKDLDLSYDGSPEQRFYDASDYRNELYDQIDAVHTLTDPTVGTDLGLRPIDAIRIAAKIDPELHDKPTVKALIRSLVERVDIESAIRKQALADMENYPDQVKAEIIPDLSDRYKELFDQLEDLKYTSQPDRPEAVIREVRVKEHMLNDMYDLVMAHRSNKTLAQGYNNNR